jgi:serine/threonine protein kinase
VPDPSPASGRPHPPEAVGGTVILKRFEHAWRTGAQPELAAYVPAAEGSLRREVLLGLMHIDLEYRLKAGQPARVEDYLARYPELAEDRPALAELAAWEHELRRRSEPGLTPEDYLERFPACREELLVRLPPGTTGPTPPPVDPTPSGLPPLGIPGYELLGELGRGGMGVVYKAHQVGLGRTVALKMILAGEQSDEALVRFQREARALARFDHPNIVEVFDAAVFQGCPYYTAEFMEGGSLADRLKGGPWPVVEAATLVRRVAEAVDWVHQQGVVHRDLKPANILLGADGTPKVADFGLARMLDGATVLTGSGAILGTPEYMAPEQAEGKNADVGPAADIWALGVILYELLTGRTPFRAPTALDTLSQVLSDEPAPPSRRRREVPRALDWICLKCLAKKPEHRYTSAAELAEDLGRVLAGKAVQAQPRRRWQVPRWRKVRAKWWGLAAGTALALLAGLSLWLLPSPEPRVTHPTTPAPPEAAGPPPPRGDQRAVQPKQEGDAKPTKARRWQLAQAKPAGGILFRRGEAKPPTPSLAPAHRLAQGQRLFAVAASPVEQRVASAGEDGAIRFWHPTQAEQMHVCLGHRGPATAVAFASDGKTLASAGEDGSVRIWSTTTGQKVHEVALGKDAVRSLAFSPDGAALFAASRREARRAWQRQPQADHWARLETPAGWLAVSADGETLATPGPRGAVSFRHLNSGEEFGRCAEGEAELDAVAFSPDGGTLALSRGGAVSLWETATGGWRAQISAPGGRVGALAFAPDGRSLATAGDDLVVRVWALATGREIGRLKGLTQPAVSVAFTGDGKLLATCGKDGLLLWNVTDVAAWALPSNDLLSPEEVEDCWTDLASADAQAAYQAAWKLVATPRQALPFIQEFLRPVVPRDMSQQVVEHLGWPVPTGKHLRGQRAVEVLEGTATAEAVRLLAALGEGAPEARLTRKAQEARRRLESARGFRKK